MAKVDKLEQYKDKLAIDRDGLGECLVDQPQLYYDVTSAHAEAVSERDAVKLELDELQADIDRKIREDAFKRDVKVTEAGIQQQIKLDPKVKGLNRSFLEVRERTEQWFALKEAFQQRSFMLRELVALRISERGDIAGAHGAGQRQDNVTELARDNMRATSDKRREYRPRPRSSRQ